MKRELAHNSLKFKGKNAPGGSSGSGGPKTGGYGTTQSSYSSSTPTASNNAWSNPFKTPTLNAFPEIDSAPLFPQSTPKPQGKAPKISSPTPAPKAVTSGSSVDSRTVKDINEMVNQLLQDKSIPLDSKKITISLLKTAALKASAHFIVPKLEESIEIIGSKTYQAASSAVSQTKEIAKDLYDTASSRMTPNKPSVPAPPVESNTRVIMREMGQSALDGAANGAAMGAGSAIAEITIKAIAEGVSKMFASPKPDIPVRVPVEFSPESNAFEELSPTEQFGYQANIEAGNSSVETPFSMSDWLERKNLGHLKKYVDGSDWKVGGSKSAPKPIKKIGKEARKKSKVGVNREASNMFQGNNIGKPEYVQGKNWQIGSVLDKSNLGKPDDRQGKNYQIGSVLNQSKPKRKEYNRDHDDLSTESEKSTSSESEDIETESEKSSSSESEESSTESEKSSSSDSDVPRRIVRNNRSERSSAPKMNQKRDKPPRSRDSSSDRADEVNAQSSAKASQTGQTRQDEKEKYRKQRRNNLEKREEESEESSSDELPPVEMRDHTSSEESDSDNTFDTANEESDTDKAFDTASESKSVAPSSRPISPPSKTTISLDEFSFAKGQTGLTEAELREILPNATPEQLKELDRHLVKQVEDFLIHDYPEMVYAKNVAALIDKIPVEHTTADSLNAMHDHVKKLVPLIHEITDDPKEQLELAEKGIEQICNNLSLHEHAVALRDTVLEKLGLPSQLHTSPPSRPDVYFGKPLTNAAQSLNQENPNNSDKGKQPEGSSKKRAASPPQIGRNTKQSLISLPGQKSAKQKDLQDLHESIGNPLSTPEQVKVAIKRKAQLISDKKPEIGRKVIHRGIQIVLFVKTLGGSEKILIPIPGSSDFYDNAKVDASLLANATTSIGGIVASQAGKNVENFIYIYGDEWIQKIKEEFQDTPLTQSIAKGIKWWKEKRGST